MEKAEQYFKIKVFMKDFGKMTKWMVMEDWYLLMEIIMKGNSKIIKQMDLENKWLH